MLSVAGLALTEGAPAEGYELKGITASPSTLLAAGEESKLAALNTLFVDSPVDLTDRSESFSVEVKLRKPSELIYLSSDVVTLHFEIVPILITRTFEGVKIAVRGAGEGQAAELEHKSATVAVTGPQLEVEALRASSLNAYIDLSGLPAGLHERPILLEVEGVNPGDMSYTVSPASVSVTLSE